MLNVFGYFVIREVYCYGILFCVFLISCNYLILVIEVFNFLIQWVYEVFLCICFDYEDWLFVYIILVVVILYEFMCNYINNYIVVYLDYGLYNFGI